ncbi:unnamed protein product [Protopolystoma xenopodis]|uniref:Uncharacterized protein n=1 Tax=Protopolystoma xenopodis TaxID=117903 RepID=A0A3S5CJZ0_9PLAT|nr:unnamed protein product [Protopolystoma xenopodis]
MSGHRDTDSRIRRPTRRRSRCPRAMEASKPLSDGTCSTPDRTCFRLGTSVRQVSVSSPAHSMLSQSGSSPRLERTSVHRCLTNSLQVEGQEPKVDEANSSARHVFVQLD